MLFTSVVIGQSNYFDFGSYNAHLKTVLSSLIVIIFNRFRYCYCYCYYGIVIIIIIIIIIIINIIIIIVIVIVDIINFPILNDSSEPTTLRKHYYNECFHS